MDADRAEAKGPRQGSLCIQVKERKRKQQGRPKRKSRREKKARQELKVRWRAEVQSQGITWINLLKCHEDED